MRGRPFQADLGRDPPDRESGVRLHRMTGGHGCGAAVDGSPRSVRGCATLGRPRPRAVAQRAGLHPLRTPPHPGHQKAETCEPEGPQVSTRRAFQSLRRVSSEASQVPSRSREARLRAERAAREAVSQRQVVSRALTRAAELERRCRRGLPEPLRTTKSQRDRRPPSPRSACRGRWGRRRRSPS
jgi:hypothetical protein